MTPPSAHSPPRFSLLPRRRLIRRPRPNVANAHRDPRYARPKAQSSEDEERPPDRTDDIRDYVSPRCDSTRPEDVERVEYLLRYPHDQCDGYGKCRQDGVVPPRPVGGKTETIVLAQSIVDVR
jgi:hypothetical protein